MSALDAEQMREYATQMYVEGETLHDTHTGPGLCAACGRVWPCPDRARGLELMGQYRQWVSGGITRLVAS